MRGPIVVLVAAGCSSEPPVMPMPDEPIGVKSLIVSDPDPTGASYVSLPPRSLDAVSVQVWNTTTGGSTSSVPVVDSGFDPVAITATVGDELHVSFTFVDGTTRYASELVPVARNPEVVRMLPRTGSENVSVTATATIVMSEPIAAGTYGGVHLTPGAFDVITRIHAPSQPWLLEVTPAYALIGETIYALAVTSALTDLEGDAALPARDTFTTTAVPMPVPLTTPLAFVSNRDGTDRIYIARSDGTITPLVEGVSPAWSPDGQHIAFVLGDWYSKDAARPMYVIDRDGSNLRSLGIGGRPAWSPDGSQIAFIGDDYGLYVMNADGTNVRLLLPRGTTGNDADGWNCLCNGDPSWFPDGKSIAVERLFDVYLVPVDGSEPQRYLISRSPTWSPDGSRILFLDSGFVSMSLDGSDRRELASVVGIAAVDRADWSPDGQAIVFSGALAQNTDTPFRMRIIVTSGTALQQEIPDVANPVKPDYMDYDAAWSRVP